jgi:hypothetical protein
MYIKVTHSGYVGIYSEHAEKLLKIIIPEGRNKVETIVKTLVNSGLKQQDVDKVTAALNKNASIDGLIDKETAIQVVVKVLRGEYDAKEWIKKNIRKVTSKTVEASQQVSKKYKVELEQETDIDERIHVRIFRKKCE